MPSASHVVAVRTGVGAPTVDPTPAPNAEAVLQAIGARPRSRWRRLARWAVLAVVLGSGAIAVQRWLAEPPPAPRYETVAIDRGDIDQTVQATGTLQARRVVSVGGEISGRVASVEVEVNDRVTKGQVLATLDPASLDNALTEAKGALAAAKIGVSRASATTKAAKVTKDRAESLFGKGLVPREELENAQSAHTLAQADEARARSDRDLAAIRVEQAQTDRAKATITSPIDGVVLTRSVEPGNAISASLEAPELFLLAEDLSAMRLHLGVDEADVGRVQAGQAASFTVDAWPGRTFEAQVERVDLSPAVSETATAVVTYTAVLAVQNEGERLRPGMTATATIVTARHEDALRVPVLALRFDPDPEVPAAPETKASNPLQPTIPGRRQNRSRGARSGGEGEAARRGGKRSGVLHVLRDGQPTPIDVRLGASDGRFTQIETDALQAGDDVVVSMEVAS